MKNKFRLGVIVFLVVIIVAISRCNFYGSSVSGKVLEVGTEKPIADAVVVVYWKGHLATIGHGSTVCYHVLSTTTDAKGRYRVPFWIKAITEPWQKNVSHEAVYSTAYKAGYDFANVPREDYHVKYLVRDTRDPKKRLNFLQSLVVGIHCSGGRESQDNLVPLYQAMLEEANSLAVDIEDRIIADSFLSEIEMIQLGYDTAIYRALERAKKRR